mgnify:CR=1 FL=1
MLLLCGGPGDWESLIGGVHRCVEKYLEPSSDFDLKAYQPVFAELLQTLASTSANASGAAGVTATASVTASEDANASKTAAGAGSVIL